jgi:multimeric flavodoxin WrbA
MHILGLSNGSIEGNSEILLKASLQAAQSANPSLTTSFIHVPSVSIPRNAPPVNDGSNFVSGLMNTKYGEKQAVPDDRAAVLDAILGADALIFATPVYSHQPAGTLKAMTDSILGPYVDAAFARIIAKGHEEKNPKFMDMTLDKRLLKPKIAAFIVVCGSDPSAPDQWTMGLPTMHMFAYPLHAKIVDQFIAPGCAQAGAVVLDDKAYIKRAQRLGENVASQIGKEFDEARYLGEEEEDACPYCHLLKLEFINGTKSNDVRCVVCGAEGKLEVRADRSIQLDWAPNSAVSSLTMEGKVVHLNDIFSATAKTKLEMQAQEVQSRLEYWKNVRLDRVVLPSDQAR